MRKSTFKSKSIARSVAGAMRRIQQCWQRVTCAVTDFAWLWLSPLLCLEHLGSLWGAPALPGTGRGAGCSGEGIPQGERDAGQQHQRGQGEGEEQRRIQSREVRDRKGEKEGDWLILRSRMIFPSPSWTLKLETPRALWIYAFTVTVVQT